MTNLTDHPTADPVTHSWTTPPTPPPPAPTKVGRGWPVKKIVAGVALVLVGVGIGSASGGSSGKTEIANLRAAKDSAEATLVDFKIQAAKDVAAAQAKPARVVTETKEVAPPACLRALDIAGQINDISADQAGNLGDYFHTVSNLAGSGDMLDFLNGMTSATKRLTSQTSSATDKITALTPSWKTARDNCRAAG